MQRKGTLEEIILRWGVDQRLASRIGSSQDAHLHTVQIDRT